MTVTATEAIHKEIRVDASPETAFRVFVGELATWWPLHKYGLFPGEASTVVVEGEVGGRIIERAEDGREGVWGEVIEYAVSSRFRCTWHPGWPADSEPTELEVTFTADAGGTLVTLEHSGWERLRDEDRRRRAGYDDGWDEVLKAYQPAA